ncbi:MAG: heat shock protein HspQ [Planctomycetota bacterium]|jgi:heat shock protein HspQ
MEIDQNPHFAPGQLVRHRRYGYRGVVAEFDTTCQADELWYYQNETQPPRNQPWYHVLVDGSNATTYAAQTSLMADEALEPVDHPLVAELFTAFENGRYERSDLRIQGWTD